jgi:Flp pilus assembly protein TadG
LLKKALQSENGAVLVIAALLMVVLLGFAGLVTDYGYYLSEKHKLQSAAEAAALAGGLQLPDTSTAISKAIEYANYNYNSIGNTNISFAKNDTRINVNLTTTVKTFFMSLYGFNAIPLQLTVSAEIKTAGVFNYAIFSGSQVSDLTITGGGWTAKGSIHSNKNLILNGGGFTITNNAEAANQVTVIGGGYSIGNIQNKTVVIAMPDYSNQVAAAATAAGQVYIGNKTINGGGISLNSPMYVKGNVTLIGGNFTGKGAIMADGDITINGGGVQIAGTDQVCFYSKNGNITFTGGGGTFYGVLYAPNGKITIMGGGCMFDGSIVGNQVVLTGGAINVNNSDFPIKSLPGTVSLVE